MKKITIAFVACLQIFFSAHAEENDLAAGIAVAEKGLVGYGIQYHSRKEDGGYSSASGKIDLDSWLTSLIIEKVDILEGGYKLPSIPFPEEGYFQDFSIYIHGIDENGESIGFGEAHYKVLSQDTVIEIEFRIEGIVKIIQIGGKPGDQISIDGGQIKSYWNSYYGGFWIWADIGSSFGDHSYEIANGGDIIERGKLDFSYNVTTRYTQRGGMIDVEVKGVTISREDSNLYGEFWIDGSVPSEYGMPEEAKVFQTSFKEFAGHVEFQGDGLEQVDVYYIDGGRPVLFRTIIPIAEWGEKHAFHHFPKYDLPVVIVVKGDKKIPFHATIGHYAPTPSGGGKG